MKKILLLTVLFSFSLVFFTCGIPNYFYLGSGYVSCTSKIESNDDFQSTVVSFRLDDSYQLAKCKNCPSVFLFYFLDNNDYYNNNTNRNEMFNKFADKYGAMSRRGSLINVRAGEITPIIPTYKPADNQSKEISIYNLAFGDGSVVVRPFYHVPITCDERGVPESDSIDFKLEFEKSSKKLMLMYDFDNDSGDYRIKKEVVRADGLSFSEIITTNDFDTYADEHIDCRSIDSDTLSSIKLNVMGAVCASNGNFDNVYWTYLYDLASFDLTAI